MTIKDLKKLIENLPDDIKVGGCGHFGDFLECYSASLQSFSKLSYIDIVTNVIKDTKEDTKEDMFCILY